MLQRNLWRMTFNWKILSLDLFSNYLMLVISSDTIYYKNFKRIWTKTGLIWAKDSIQRPNGKPNGHSQAEPSKVIVKVGMGEHQKVGAPSELEHQHLFFEKFEYRASSSIKVRTPSEHRACINQVIGNFALKKEGNFKQY